MCNSSIYFLMLAALGTIVQNQNSCFYEEVGIGSRGSLCFSVIHADKCFKVKENGSLQCLAFSSAV